MIMDNSAHPHHQLVQTFPPLRSPQRADLNVSTTPPHTPSPGKNNNNNNNNETLISPTTTVGNGNTRLKRSFDVAFLMMPDERIKQKQAAKQVCLSESLDRRVHPTDLSPRQLVHPQLVHSFHEHLPEHFLPLAEARRYPQITLRSPRIYDDPSVIIPPDSDALPPIKSAFTKVVNARQESPIPPPPSLSPDQLSGSSMSPPIITPPPRTNSGNGSLSNGSTGNCTVAPPSPQIQPSIVYQNFRPEYNFNGAFHSVSQVQALQAAAVQNQRIRHQLLYRPPLSAAAGSIVYANPGAASPEFLPAYPAFPFAPGTAAAAAQHFAPITTPESPRIPLQNPAAAAILSTLIPPTLASTFTLTAQNVCAKCNISFRMTSDLVYHMRSHHKSEVACDPNRRKREEKLKCPVCNESFRERHHLTRHMTAHQDKESDSATITATTPPAHGSEPIIHVGGANTKLHSRNAAYLSK